MPGISFSWYCKDEDFHLYQKFKETIHFKAREAVDKEVERLKGLTFKTSSKLVNTSVLEDSVEDRIHGNNAKNKARMQSDKAISAKVRNNGTRAS